MRVEIVGRVAGRVRFRSAAGEAVARWAEPDPPDGGVFHVEVDVPGEVSWVDIEPADGAEHGVRWDGERTTVTGAVEGLDELGVLTLRIPDGVVLVETVGEAPTEVVARTVRVTTAELHLTPYAV